MNFSAQIYVLFEIVANIGDKFMKKLLSEIAFMSQGFISGVPVGIGVLFLLFGYWIIAYFSTAFGTSLFFHLCVFDVPHLKHNSKFWWIKYYFRVIIFGLFWPLAWFILFVSIFVR